MPGSDRLVLGGRVLIRGVQSGIAAVTIVVVTTLAKVEPPWQCGAIEQVRPIKFLFSQLPGLFIFPARTFVFVPELAPQVQIKDGNLTFLLLNLL